MGMIIISDTLRTNPIWYAIERRTLYGLIITPPSEENRNGDDFQIYVTDTGRWDFDYFKRMIIGKHRMDGDYWRKDLRLYVKDGSVPEDVRQLFEKFGIEYTVLDERVLYRGKSKDPYATKGGTP